MIDGFSAGALDWLEQAELLSVKEASQAARALCIWGRAAARPISWLEASRSGDHWESDNPVRDTARACAALQGCGISGPDPTDWLPDMQYENGSWNDDVYDTCYVLLVLKEPKGAAWLLENLSGDWMHPGTVALINMALRHQGGHTDTISGHVSWLLDQGPAGHWKYTVTTCLVVQSLLLSGHRKGLDRSIRWLLDRMERHEWKVSQVAQVLVTLKMYNIHTMEQA